MKSNKSPHKVSITDWDKFSFTKQQIVDSISYFDEMIHRNGNLGVPIAHFVSAKKKLLKLRPADK